MRREIGAIGTLGREIGRDRRLALGDHGIEGSQEVDHHLDRRAIILRLDGPDHSKVSKLLTGLVTLVSQCIDQPRILLVFSERLGIEAEVNIGGADVAHLALFKEQPGDRTADHRKLATVASQGLADFHQD